MSLTPFDDDFWRRHDRLLGVVPVPATEITNRLPVIGSVTDVPATPPPQTPEIDIDALRCEVDETVRRSMELERQNADRDTALRAVVQAFEQQLADMEADHPRRLDAIRLGAEAAAERTLAEAHRRAAALTAGRDTSDRGADDHGI